MNTVPEQIDHLFRHESGKVVAALMKRLGADRIDLAEDIVQDVLIRALEKWPTQGMPNKPLHWMMSVARNLAMDRLRHERMERDHSPTLAEHITFFTASPIEATLLPLSDSELQDDMLRMIFACADPSLSRESQMILILRLLFGFRVPDIAIALSMSEPAAQKRLVRAKEKFRSGELSLEVPQPCNLSERVGAALNVLYLIFALGSNTKSIDQSLRETLRKEAQYLAEVLADSRHLVDDPRVEALLSLMHFRMAVDASGWQQRNGYLEKGIAWMTKSARGDTISQYHIESALAKEIASDQPNQSRMDDLYEILSLMTQ